jgi:hypothetical protein
MKYVWRHSLVQFVFRWREQQNSVSDSGVRIKEQYRDSVSEAGKRISSVQKTCRTEIKHIIDLIFFNLRSGGWNQGPLDTAAT